MTPTPFEFISMCFAVIVISYVIFKMVYESGFRPGSGYEEEMRK